MSAQGQIPTDVLAIDRRVVTALTRLKRLVAAVKTPGQEDSEFDRVLDVLRRLSRKENIPLAIVGGLAAIRFGYERLTQDIDIVVGREHLDTIIRVAPSYGVKVIWHAPDGWHKLSCEGIKIEVVPEGARASKDAPTTIPSPRQLGVNEGSDYATLEGWMETKLSAARTQDRADVVQVLKRLQPEALDPVRRHLDGVHPRYRQLLEELVTTAEEEKQQERERGGERP